jgi:hypothetical protein
VKRRHAIAAVTFAFAAGFSARLLVHLNDQKSIAPAVVVAKAPNAAARTRIPKLAAPGRPATSGPIVVRAGDAPPGPYRPHYARFHERDPREWQGMRMDVAMMPPCESSEQCGLARACIGGRCGPCSQDEQCATGEICALDHCLVARQVECRGRRNCREDIMCILTGYTPDARGNAGLRSMCLTPDRVPAQQEPNFPPSAFIDPPSRLRSFRQHLTGKAQ